MGICKRCGVHSHERLCDACALEDRHGTLRTQDADATMTNIITIGRPFGFGKHDREEVERQKAVHLSSSKFQLRQVIGSMRVLHGDGATKATLLEIAKEFWPEG